MPQITERGLGQMIHYVCKYTPVELLNAFGEECAVLEEMPENFEMSDQIGQGKVCTVNHASEKIIRKIFRKNI